MKDPYASLASQDASLQNSIGDALETRCREQAQIEIRKAYLSEIRLSEYGFAVELGSGTGHVTQELLTLSGVERALGIEPSPVLVERAKRLFSHEHRLTFQMGDAKSTNLHDESVDLVLMHTLLCHVPGPEEVLKRGISYIKTRGCSGDLRWRLQYLNNASG